MVLVFAGAAIWIADELFFKKQRAAGEKPGVIVENARALTPVLALVFVIRSFLYEPFQIPSGSMERTLLTGDFILVNKFHYGIRLPVWRTKVFDVNEPERGDVMVFFPPHREQYFIKRVIGLPGDHVVYKDKVLYINGKEQKQTMLPMTARRVVAIQFNEQLGDVEHEIQQYVDVDRSDDVDIVVPEGHYFMMGDNRDNSADSREWGPVPSTRIVGKAVAVWMHKKPGLNMPTFDRVGGIR